MGCKAGTESMRNATIIALIFCLGCSEESVNWNSNKQLVQITVNDVTDHSFEYERGLLVKENSFNFCKDNPSDEFEYVYVNDRLSMIQSTMRGLYSNSGAICDPKLGIRFDEQFEYSDKNEIIKIVRASSYTTFAYNSKGLVEKQTMMGGPTALESTYEYDDNGNLVEETDSNGDITQYEYDDKINPYYRMNQRPGWISPFNKSPNNVIKASGKVNFQRTFQYDGEGFPVLVSEDNGLEYKFMYR